MTQTSRLALQFRVVTAVAGLLAVSILLMPFRAAAIQPSTPCWQVDDIRPGMKGYGCSVFKGTKIERFDVEVLGVMKNTSPGRDLILARLSGCNLDKTCVIAGMSGSPVYVDGKLLGAVSYAWAFGKEPIAGVTPFCQMVEYAEAQGDVNIGKKSTTGAPSRRFPLSRPVFVADRSFDSVTVAGPEGTGLESYPTSADGLWLTPLQTPLIAGGFTEHSLRLLSERVRWTGLAPMQAGSAASYALKEQANASLEPGAPLAVALVSGDFDLSGIGTVTHVEGDRVYGWGHPFLSLGQCELPLMSGYIHTIYPRQSVSFKMGSPLRTLGVVDADVSTCIAGRLGHKPDLLPVDITVAREPVAVAVGSGLNDGSRKLFNPEPTATALRRHFQCEIVRNKQLSPQLLYTTLTNSVDMEGDLPEELTAEMQARIEFEGRPPLVIHDTYSGPSYSGGRAPAAMYSQIAALAQIVVNNPFQPLRIERISCATRLAAGRSTAEIEAVELNSETFAPGDTVKAAVTLRPYKGTRQRATVELKLPASLPDGAYTIQISDDLTNARQEIRESPILANPSNLDQLFQLLQVQASAKRTNLTARLALQDAGVSFEGQALPQLPGSMVEMLANSRRTGAQTMTSAIVARQPTPWVIQGSHLLKIAVTKNKRIQMSQ